MTGDDSFVHVQSVRTNLSLKDQQIILVKSLPLGYHRPEILVCGAVYRRMDTPQTAFIGLYMFRAHCCH